MANSPKNKVKKSRPTRKAKPKKASAETVIKQVRRVDSAKADGAYRQLEDMGMIGDVEKARVRHDTGNMEQPAPGVMKSDLSRLLSLYVVNPWVYAAVHRTSSAISAVRRNYFKKQGDEWVRAKKGETQIEKLLDRPNAFQHWQDLIEVSIPDLRLIGWSIWEKSFENDDPKKSVIGLKRLRPDRSEIIPDPEKYWRGIKFEAVLGEPQEIAPERLVIFRQWSPLADFWPSSGSMAAQSSIVWDLFSRAWNTAFFKNGAAGLPEGVFETEQTLTEADVNRITTTINNRHGHPDVWRSILVLGNGLKFRPTARTQVEMQFSELMDKSRDEILATLGVPPALVGVPISGGLGGFREQRMQFYQITILPLLTKLQETINTFVANEDERMEFDLHDILALVEDLNDRAASADSEINRGLTTINEVRRERGLPPVAWGDTWWAPLGLAPVQGDGRPERPEGLGMEGVQGEDQIERKIADPLVKEKLEEYFTRKSLVKAGEKSFRQRMSRRLATAYRRAFSAIKDAILTRIRDNMVREEKVLKQDEPAPQFDFRSLGAIPLDQSEIVAIIEEEVGEELINQTNGAARVAARGLGVDFSEITADNPVLAAALDRWKNDRIASTARTITNGIKTIAEDVRASGVSPQRAIRDMASKFDNLIEQRVKDLSASDATTFSSVATESQAGDVFTHKQWVTVGDGNVRDGTHGEDHTFVNGQIVKLEESFMVPGRNGDEMMDHPGDPAAGPWNNSNCRCFLLLMTAEEAGVFPGSE